MYRGWDGERDGGIAGIAATRCGSAACAERCTARVAMPSRNARDAKAREKGEHKGGGPPIRGREPGSANAERGES